MTILHRLFRTRKPDANARLTALRDARANSPEIRDFRQRRAAAKLGWARRRSHVA